MLYCSVKKLFYKLQISTDNIPTVERRKMEPTKATTSEKREFSKLFLSDSEDDADHTEEYV